MDYKRIMKRTLYLFLTIPLLSLSGISLPVNGASESETDFGELKFTFQVMSDTEVIASTPNAACNLQFNKALSQIEEMEPNSSAIFVAGDVLNRGLAENWKYFNSIVEKHTGLPKVYTIVGNHDLTDNGTYTELFGNYMKYSGMTGTYYDEWINGIHFIVLGQEDSGHNKPEYSEEQFKWLEEKLAEDASYDKPIFLFSHYSIRNTSAGTYLGSQIGHSVGSEDKLRFMELLKKYPQVIYFTGHTHFALTDENTHYNVDIQNGNGADIICDGSVSYLCDGTWEAITGAQFCFVEVYERGVKVKGWDILNEKWIEEAQFDIDTTSKTPTEMAVPAIELSTDFIDPAADNKEITAYITYEDTNRIEASDGAWVGLVTSGSEDVAGDTLRWVMLKNLPKDDEGRFVWNITDDSLCQKGSVSWENMLKRRGTIHIGLFEDTLYLGQQPTVPTYRSYRYDPYARLAKGEIFIGSAEDIVIPGDGTKEAPYLISKPVQFVYMMDQIAAGEHYDGKYFLQTADLDFTNMVYNIIDSAEIQFAGTYNGGGYLISNLSLTSNGGTPLEYNAVFPTVTGTLLNVGVTNTTVDGVYASGLVRKLADGGKLINSYSRAAVNGTSRGTGLADYMTGKAPLLANCYFAGNVSGNAVCGSNYNASNPTLNRVYYESGTAAGTSPFGTVTAKSKEEIQSQIFVDILNENLESAAKAASIEEADLAEWMLGKDGYPTLIPTGSDPVPKTAVETEKTKMSETNAETAAYLSEETFSEGKTEHTAEEEPEKTSPLSFIITGIGSVVCMIGGIFTVIFCKKKKAAQCKTKLHYR